jgi:hypothetical protein
VVKDEHNVPAVARINKCNNTQYILGSSIVFRRRSVMDG